MTRTLIPFDKLALSPFAAWDERWFLLSAGTLDGGFNTMTVAWGALGIFWQRPHALVLVRPTRHTYAFMESSPDFTLSLLPTRFEDAMMHIGTHSGRDEDKLAAVGLDAEPSQDVGSPTIAQAELVLECRKAYFDDLEPRHFLDPRIHEEYDDDHHRLYVGEVLSARGTADWRAD